MYLRLICTYIRIICLKKHYRSDNVIRSMVRTEYGLDIMAVYHCRFSVLHHYYPINWIISHKTPGFVALEPFLFLNINGSIMLTCLKSLLVNTN